MDFKEELKKFSKSLDATEIEDALVKFDITDMNDIILKTIKENINE